MFVPCSMIKCRQLNLTGKFFRLIDRCYCQPSFLLFQLFENILKQLWEQFLMPDCKVKSFFWKILALFKVIFVEILPWLWPVLFFVSTSFYYANCCLRCLLLLKLLLVCSSFLIFMEAFTTYFFCDITFPHNFWPVYITHSH